MRLSPPFASADLSPDAPPILTPVIDTEEAFDWSAGFRRDARDASNVLEQGGAMEVYARFGAVPIYLCDHAVLEDARAARILSDWAAVGLCETGAHLHPWLAPPYEESLGAHESYGGNLPPELERAKLAHLTNRAMEAFGAAPFAFKAGRYGLGPATAGILRDLGYGVDLSVTPRRSHAADGGPDFQDAPEGPFWLDRPGGLLEIPTTEGLAGPLGSGALGARLAPLFDSPGARRLHAPGILARARLAERVRLSPEGGDVPAMRRLLKALIGRGVRVFTLSYHSSSLQVGGSPYAPDAAARDGLIQRIKAILEIFQEEFGGRPAPLSQAARLCFGTAKP